MLPNLTSEDVMGDSSSSLTLFFFFVNKKARIFYYSCCVSLLFFKDALIDEDCFLDVFSFSVFITETVNPLLRPSK